MITQRKIINALGFNGFCICSVLNYLLIIFIVISFYYLFKRLNRIGVSNKQIVENFANNALGNYNRVGPGDLKKHVEEPLNRAGGGLNKIAKSLDSIEKKLDIVSGYVTLTDEDEQKKRLEENKKILENDDNEDDNEIEGPPRNPLYRKDYGKYVYERQSLEDILKNEKKEN
jgi:hypothetical protein